MNNNNSQKDKLASMYVGLENILILDAIIPEQGPIIV